MILITGATGLLGGAVVQQLLTRVEPGEIAVLVRDRSRAADLEARGVSVRIGDYEDTDSLTRAIDGAARVLLVAANDLERRMAQHRNVIAAAVEAGVEVLGFTSRSLHDMAGAGNRMMRDYFATEALIADSGLPALLFRNALYLDTLTYTLGGAAVFDTGIQLPAADGRVAYALRREMGEATANAMLDHPGGDRTYVLSAPRAYSFDDIATALAEISGTSVSYEPVSDEAFIAGKVAVGVPQEMARRLAGFFVDIRANQLDETSGDLEVLLGRPPAVLRDGLAELFSLPTGGPTPA